MPLEKDSRFAQYSSDIQDTFDTIAIKSDSSGHDIVAAVVCQDGLSHFDAIMPMSILLSDHDPSTNHS